MEGDADQLRGRVVAQHPRGRWVGFEHDAVARDDDPVGSGLDQPSEAGPLGAEGVLHGAALGGIPEEGDEGGLSLQGELRDDIDDRHEAPARVHDEGLGEGVHLFTEGAPSMEILESRVLRGGNEVGDGPREQDLARMTEDVEGGVADEDVARSADEIDRDAHADARAVDRRQDRVGVGRQPSDRTLWINLLDHALV